MRYSGLCALTMLLTACASAQPPAHYLLPALQTETRVQSALSTIAVREIAMPLYARAAQVATLNAEGAATLSDDHRWADEPQRAATNALVATLSDVLQTRVVAEPWPAAERPDLRVDVTVERFIGALGGDVALTGQYRIVAPAGGLRAADRFSYTVPTGAAGYAALTKAHALALQALGEDIARAIAE